MPSVMRLSRRSLIVAALGLGLTVPAFAETVTVTDITRSAGENATITVPTVELTDASIGEAEVRALFATDSIESLGETLVDLVARSVLIPEIRIEGGEVAADGTDTRRTVVLSNVEMTDVAHGIAGGISVGSASFEGTTNATRVSLGAFALADLNIGYLFALLGIGDAAGLDPRALESVWTSLSLGESGFEGPQGTCSIGGIEAGTLAVRMPERTSLPALFAFVDKVKATQAEAAETSDPAVRSEKSQQALDEAAQLQSYYFDVLTSYAAGPLMVAGVDCAVTNEQGDPVAFSLGEVTVGEAFPGTLPDIAVTGMEIENTGSDAGTMTLDSMHILPSDYTAVADLFAKAGDAVDHEWLQANQRRIVPSFGGFEMGSVVMDLPSTSAAGARIVGSIGSLTALFDTYVNGIPTDVRSSATDVTFELPKDSSGQMLAMLGLDPLSVSYDLSARWDPARHEIIVDNLMLSAENGGTVILSGVLGNAKPQLFSLDPKVAMEASTGLTIKETHLYLGDAGLLANVLAMVAQQQNTDPDQMRTAMAAMTQSMIMLGLGATPPSIEVAGAIGDFLRNGGELSLSAVAKSPAGVSVYEMQTRGADPTQVIKQFDLMVGGRSEDAQPAEEPDAAAPATEQEAPAEPSSDDAAAAPVSDGKEKSK